MLRSRVSWIRGLCCVLTAGTFLALGSAAAQGLPVGTAHSVTLTWQAPSPVGGSGTVSGYNVYRSAASAAVYAKVNTAVTVGLTYTDTTVAAGSSYSYCVTTVDSLNEESACSTAATANVPSNPNAPSAPLITVK
ncbi:MAG TPA: fibronectin type III domain-containing protein [Candidatus Acidoferrales bacterium]|nr:fibronectin type III domain-containing protein [Candidatus Acidoferrales bacterium]